MANCGLGVRKVSQTNRAFGLGLFLTWLFLASSTQAQELIRVDVPALAEGRKLVSPFAEGAEAGTASEKLVQLSLPVSVWLDPSARDSFYDVEFKVSWARSLYPLVDYWPKSSLQSEIAGVVLTEQHSEKRLSGGVATDGLLQTFATVANASGALEQQVNRRYAEIPDREPLVESGPTERSTGAFFRFHDSRQVIVEGGRELQLLYRLPQTWRAGLMIVETRVYQRVGLGVEPRVSYQRRFTLPVHLAEDESAKLQAVAYIQAESQLRSLWERDAAGRSGAGKFSTALLRRGRGAAELEMMLSEGSGAQLRAASEHFNGRFRAAAEQLLTSRDELLSLSR